MRLCFRTTRVRRGSDKDWICDLFKRSTDRTRCDTGYVSRGQAFVQTSIELSDKKQASTYDIYIVPGGAKGSETISQNTKVQALLKAAYEEGKIVGMICAGEFGSLRYMSSRSHGCCRFIGGFDDKTTSSGDNIAPKRKGVAWKRYKGKMSIATNYDSKKSLL